VSRIGQHWYNRTQSIYASLTLVSLHCSLVQLIRPLDGPDVYVDAFYMLRSALLIDTHAGRPSGAQTKVYQAKLVKVTWISPTPPIQKFAVGLYLYSWQVDLHVVDA